ncbi:hypothetical protein GKR67_05975 [Providencia alcalifaciens]|uniref:Uncharacterized protein n=1 Tax=Providencia alcalifaciens TaxID=126385 RepID=A0AAW9V8S1_9GAMM|nr:hypothetical protein [Providencia alcalifaciens]
MSNNHASTNNMSQPKIIITATPVCYVRQLTPLKPQIDISKICTDEFCEPIFMKFSEHDVQLSHEYIRELQAQGVDKLINSLQNALNLLHERDCAGAVTSMLKDEINSCKAFARRLRNPIDKSNLCDSCNDWMRGGCSSMCSAYGVKGDHHA